jgi:putative ABC transport system substrate-binding protein
MLGRAVCHWHFSAVPTPPSDVRFQGVSSIGQCNTSCSLLAGARAQQPAMPTVGFLNTASPDPYAERVHAFRQGLSEAGYIEGQNVVVEYRWAEGRYDRLQAMAAELVRRQVAVIAATGGAAPVLAAKAATATIPIVFQAGVDPVDAGLVASLSRPGGNVTGVTNLNVELGAKRLELLRELIPTATVVALLVNPTNPNAETLSRDVQAAALTLGQQIHVLRASTGRELETAFATLGDLRANGLVIGADGFFVSRSEQLATLAVRHKLPTIFQFRQFAAAGGLMSLGEALPNNIVELASTLVGFSKARGRRTCRLCRQRRWN